ncbi:MAG TPA: aspartate/glutamate racemase family protein, partial [Diaminobutyricibacter sp.]
GAVSVVTEIERCEASTDRPDAYVVACFGDTGVAAARESAAGPVVGMTEAALMTAALLAHRFAVITMPRRTLRQSEQVVRSLGLEHRCTILAVDEPVAELAGGSLHLLDLFVAEGRAAIADHAAEAIVLGCAGLAELVGPLHAALGVPVIEGVAAAVTIAEGLVAQSLTTSRAGAWARSSSPAESVNA